MIYILLPCYNEYKNLLPLIKKINQINLDKNIKINILIVNDGSTDDTHKKIKKLKKISKNKIIYLKHKTNFGLNIALLNGFKKIITLGRKKDIVITLDSDNTHPINLIPKMYHLLNQKNYDIAIASRFQNGSKVRGLSFFRTFLSIAARIVFKFVINIKNVNDYTCNFRAYKFDVLKKSKLINKKFFSNKDFSIASDLLININKNINSLNICEIPLILRYDNKIGPSKMSVGKNIIKTFILIFKNL